MNTQPEYQKRKLDNGLVLVAERHTHVRSVSLGLWVRVGSVDESGELLGISHFIEHMVFKSTKTRTPLEIVTALESKGGELNAFTDKEHTCYHAMVLSEDLEIALDILSDIAIHPTFPKNEVERERGVLLQELAMVEEAPEEWILDLLIKQVWSGEPLGSPIVGLKKTLRQMTRSQLLKYFKQYYRPENMVLSVAGNFNWDELNQLTEKYFKFSAKQAKLPTKRVASKYHRRHKQVVANTEQTHVMVAFDAPSYHSEHRFTLMLLSFYLGGGMSSRLFQEIREKAGLAYTVDCDYMPFNTAGLFTVYAAMSARSVPKCMDILRRELLSLQTELIDPDALARVNSQLKGMILLSSDEMDSRQESVGRNELVYQRYVSASEVVEKLESVTPLDVQQVAREIFVAKNESVVTLARSKGRKKPLTIF